MVPLEIANEPLSRQWNMRSILVVGCRVCKLASLRATYYFTRQRVARAFLLMPPAHLQANGTMTISSGRPGL